MASPITEYRVRATEHRIDFVERELRDHHQATECAELQSVIADATLILVDLFEIDADLQDMYLDGTPRHQPLDERVTSIFNRWLVLAKELESRAFKFEEQGYSVEGVDQLRIGIADVVGGTDPSCEMDDKLTELRDNAVEEHRRGHSVRIPA